MGDEVVYEKPITIRLGETIHTAMKQRARRLHHGYFHYAYRLGCYVVLGMSEPTYRLMLRKTLALAEDRVPLDQAVREIAETWRAALVADQASAASQAAAAPEGRSNKSAKSRRESG